MRNVKRAAVAAACVAALGFSAPAFAYTETDMIIAQGHGTITPSYLVIHSTANPGATAADHVSYWKRQGNGAYMSQWVCDWTGNVYQVAPGNALTWHVGNGNRYSVGIEICEGATREQFDASVNTAAQWAADYLTSKGWGVDRMVSHNQARSIWGGTDHTDPDTYFKRWGYSWSQFVNLVSSYMNGGSSQSSGSDSSPLGDADWTGPLMWTELQRQLGTPADGSVSGQTGYNANAIQWAVTVSPRESPSVGSLSVTALQRQLNASGYDVGPDGADGHMGPATVRALQRYLNDSLGCGLAIDGYYGNATSRAMYAALQKKMFD